MDPPLSDALLDLSTTDPKNTAEIISCLNRLSDRTDLWVALRRALPEIYEYVRVSPRRAGRIAHHLYQTIWHSGTAAPDDLRFLDRYNDLFEQPFYAQSDGYIFVDGLRDFLDR
jgi:hypothetical protein